MFLSVISSLSFCTQAFSVKLSAEKRPKPHPLPDASQHPPRVNLDKREAHMFSSLGNKGRDDSETEHFLISVPGGEYEAEKGQKDIRRLSCWNMASQKRGQSDMETISRPANTEVNKDFVVTSKYQMLFVLQHLSTVVWPPQPPPPSSVVLKWGWCMGCSPIAINASNRWLLLLPAKKYSFGATILT